jgi:hypothetical protein
MTELETLRTLGISLCQLEELISIRAIICYIGRDGATFKRDEVLALKAKMELEATN